jgi:small subunit ribosomal protein S21
VIGITVQENENIDKALKRFKKKYERSGILKEYKKRTFYVKPSIEKRMDAIKAKRRASREQAFKDKKA